MSKTLPSGRQVRVSAHGQHLTVVEVGGGIREYGTETGPVLDGYGADEMCGGGRGQLLAPWPNRLEDGSFEWEGRALQTAITEVATNCAIHGLVRWASWQVDPDGEDGVCAAFRLHPQPGWPWTIDFEVRYRLSASGLTVTTSATNRSDLACPVGLGWHPYLYAFGGTVDDLVLTVPARRAYRSDSRGLPDGTFEVARTDVDFRTGRPIGAARLDTCFTDLDRGADGRAVAKLVAGDGRGSASLWVDETYSHLMVFSGDTLGEPARRRRGLAVEPMTGPPNLLRTGDGRRRLEPGSCVEGTWGVEVFS